MRVLISVAVAMSMALVLEAQSQQCNATVRSELQKILAAAGLALAACPDEPPPPPPPPPPTNVGVKCGEPMDRWHPPVVDTESGPCQVEHEHGDAPPAWIADAGYQVRFGDVEATPNENAMKHQAYKGYHFVQPTGPNAGQEWYWRYHAATNPHDRGARFHSYALWARSKEPVGGGPRAVSVFRGWYDTGDRIVDRYVPPEPEPQIRPAIFPINQAAWNAGHVFETWYMVDHRSDRQEDAGWRPGFGLNIGAASTYYVPGEHLQAHDHTSWQLTGEYGLTRRIELSWYGPDDPAKSPVLDTVPRNQVFYADQFGRLLSGPDDPLVGQPVTYGDQTFTRIAIPQYLADSLRAIGFPHNAVQREFPCPGCKVPN